MKSRYVFGPIHSRRLGRSLGVDLVTEKTCSLDCTYCEAGETTELTLERREYAPVERILKELDETLSTNPELDWITFSGTGEPTLNSRIGEVVSYIKSRYAQYKLCLLTNGLLLGDEKLRSEISGVDLVIPSFDASCEEEFIAINRPAAGMSFERYLRGMREFLAQKERPETYIELFIVPGINDSSDSLNRFSQLLTPMHPDLVQLNALDRPGTQADLKVAPHGILERFRQVLSATMAVEIIGH